MRARLTSNHFVGRVGELAELELGLQEVTASRPVLVLLAGESGVGKTRLVSEFERRVCGPENPVAHVLRGETVEQRDGELPYAPVLSALRPLIRERHPVLSALSAGSRSQLGALLPGLGEDHPGGAAERSDPSAQLRLFEALLELLDLLSEDRPLALILEDMHWADRSTRAFVSFLARSLRQERVMLLLTYRSDELHRRHALRPLLSELERLERARRIELVPFDRGELTEALTDILGDEPSDELAERLFRRSEGNPLYTEELLAAGLDGRGAAPQSLRDAFLSRIERLPPDAQRVARMIAVGRGLDESSLADLIGIEAAALQTALREALSEQVLVIDAAGRFAFRHALLREALYDDLLPGERSELHLVLARYFEGRPLAHEEREFERATRIATDYAAAGDQPAALRSTIRAALAARDVHAYGEAADLAERGLELWPRVPDAAAVSDLDNVDLLILAASAHSIADDRNRSDVLLRSALREVDPETDPRRFAAVLSLVARIEWTLNRQLQALETADRALTLLPEAPMSEERASLLAWRSRINVLRGRLRNAIGEGEEALAAAREVGDTASEIEVLNTLGTVLIARGEIEAGVAHLRQAMDIARRTDNLDSLGWAYGNLADLLNIRGETRLALAAAREGLEAIPRRMAVTRDWLLLTLSELEFEVGEWRSAREHLVPSLSQAIGVLLLFRLLREAELVLGEGDEDRAAELLDQAGPLVVNSSEPQWIGSYGSLLGELRRRQGDLIGAREAVAHALDRIELCTDDVSRIARVTAVGARVEADAAQRARDLREPRDERDALARTRIHTQRLRAIAEEGGPVERAWSAVSAAELTRARGRSDPRLWAKAADAWEAIERPYLVAQVRWREAEAQVEAGDRAKAAEPARAAIAIAQELGAGWLLGEIRALRDRARLELGREVSGAEDGAAGEAVGGDGPASEDPFGLTPRERQVLALIAEGATNRQIGAALFMAEKTASVHVSRILAKLGVRSRTQAAAVAHRLHLRA